MDSMDIERKEDDCNHSHEDDNELDEYELLHQAFVRPPVMSDDDLSAPPTSGEQFLQRVIEETKRCKAVVVANVKRKPQRINQVPHFPEKKECSTVFLPTKDWQTSTTSDFSRLRLDMETLRNKLPNETVEQIRHSLPKDEEDKDAWLQICTQERSDLLKNPASPSTQLCLAMTQMQNWNFLSHFPDWLREGVLGIQDGCRWIYCLLACLELPVSPSVYFKIRQIARALTDHRAQLKDPQSEELPHINLVVCVIGRYFNQEDLADPYI